jgi:hypothetical protein
MEKKAILIIGPDGSGRDFAATLARLYVQKNTANTYPVIFRLTDNLFEGINRAFGLMFSAATYLDKADEPLPEFFGWTPRQTYDDVLKFFQEKYKHNFLGRICVRRIKNETTSRIFIIPMYEGGLHDAEAIATGLGAKNVLCLHLNERPTEQYTKNLVLRDCSHRFIDNSMRDRDLFSVCIRGAAKAFLGIVEDE